MKRFISINNRRERVLERLKESLRKGTKTEKGSTKQISLTDKEIKRIGKEITILEIKLKRTS